VRGAVRLAIKQPLTFGAAQQGGSALRIVNPELGAIAIPEIEFSEVPMQMGLRNVMIGTVNPALKNRKVSFGGICVSIAPYIFAR
jgi:hypothetical protein